MARAVEGAELRPPREPRPAAALAAPTSRISRARCRRLTTIFLSNYPGLQTVLDGRANSAAVLVPLDPKSAVARRWTVCKPTSCNTGVLTACRCLVTPVCKLVGSQLTNV